MINYNFESHLGARNHKEKDSVVVVVLILI